MNEKTFGRLLDAMKKPVTYKFTRRKRGKVPIWQQLTDAKTVSAEDLLNLLTDYIGAGLPRLQTLEGIFDKTSGIFCCLYF